MKFNLTFSTLTLAVILLSGCASNEPSPAMKEWARQQIAEKQRLEVAQATHDQEVARLKAENERIKAQAEADKRQAEAVAWVANNKKTITTELTKTYGPAKQDALEALGFQGKALGYLVDDVVLEQEVLFFSQVLLWQKQDGTGGVVRIVMGENLKTNQFVYNKVTDVKDLSRQELAAVLGQDQAIPKVAAPQASVWAPSNETVNSGYQAAIKAASTAAGVIIVKMLAGN